MAQTLLQKLRLTPNQVVTVLHRPTTDYFSELSVSEEYPKEPVETMILFVNTLEELTKEIFTAIEKNILIPNGRLLVAYPKKGNKQINTYVHRDAIFPALQVDDTDGYIPNSEYKFNQMVKLDDTYTIIGLKRVEKKNGKTIASQPVADYISYIPAIEKDLENDPHALLFFRSLTPGYQKNWARFVYSAKQETTQLKRKQEMIHLLNEGVKFK